MAALEILKEGDLMRVTWLFFLMLALSLSAHAGEWGLVAHGASMHFTQREHVPWNETNDGFGLRYAVDDTYAIQAGHYRNSYSMPGFNFFTNYALVDYTPLHVGHVHMGVFGGAASGYDEYRYYWYENGRSAKAVVTKDGIIIPIGGLVGRLQLGKFNVATRIAPNLIAFEGGFKF